MPQLGEKISLPDLVSDRHSKATCPWHDDRTPPAPQPMDPQAPDEDTDAMPANLGTKLGENLGEKEDEEIWVTYEPGARVRYEVSVKGKKQRKFVRTYREDEEWEYKYDLQYAPHHLIPGNESLKDSSVVPFMGDDDVIKNFKKQVTSKIKDKMTAGYDVNRRENGVWLPSPYALSMSNQWPALDGIAAVRKRRDGDVIGDETEDFKHAYVAAAIHKSRGKQFHMRHLDYSNEVRKGLNAIGGRLKAMARGDCPIAAGSKKDGKFDPPTGLTARLDVLSGQLKRLLVGPLWRAPLFADDKLMAEYTRTWKATKKKGRFKKVL